MSRRGRNRERLVAVDEDVSLRRPQSLESAVDRRGRATLASTTSASVDKVSLEPEHGNSSAEDGESPQTTSPVQERRSRSVSRSGVLSLGPFTGSNVPLATHLAKWRNCARYHGWDERARACQLKGSLEGTAASLLWELPDACSEAELLRALETRFGDLDQVERYRSELRVRRRRRGETLQSLYHDVCRLLALGYPGDTSEYGKIAARDAFVNCLGDEELRIRILENGATSIEQAYSVAVRYESFRAGRDASMSDESSRRRVRNVQQPMEKGSAVPSDAQMQQMEQRLGSALEQQVQQLESMWSARWAQMEASLARMVDEGKWARSSSQGRGPGSANASGFTMANVRSQSGNGRRRGALPVGPGRWAESRNQGCFSCGSMGHFSRECPGAMGRQGAPTSDCAPAESKVSMVTSAVPGGRPAPVQAVISGEIQPCPETCLPIRFKQGSKFISTVAILDSGTNQCLLPAKFAGSNLRPAKVNLVAANGTKIAVIGEKRLNFEVDGIHLYADFMVSDQVDEILMSRGWMLQNGFKWDFGDSIFIRDRCVKLKPRAMSFNTRRVTAAENVCIEPRACNIVPVNIAVTSMRGSPSNFIIEPNWLMIVQ
jgi:hypothetical protein